MNIRKISDLIGGEILARTVMTSDYKILLSKGTVLSKEYIEKLPMGIHTKIGENAIQMSGGERQRLSIARAILRGCPILLMDESTSHLDEDTASEIEKILFSLQNVTVIFVTHQLRRDTINLADEVILLENRNLNKWSG